MTLSPLPDMVPIWRGSEARSTRRLLFHYSAPGFSRRIPRTMATAEPEKGARRMDISGKTAIVTGAASGIGLGIATALAEAGANVVMADIQQAAVEAAAHGLSGTNKRGMPVRIDV